MKKRTVYNKINYEYLTYDIESVIGVLEAKNKSVEDILVAVRDLIQNTCILKPGDYMEYISSPAIRMYDAYTKIVCVTDDTILALVKKVLEYNSEIPYRTKIVNIFTYIEYYFNPKKFEEYKQNYKYLMKDSIGPNR